MDPASAQFYNDGNKLLKAGDYQGAVTKYIEALKTSDDHRIHYQKGVAYKKMRKYSDAEASFTSCIKSNPNFGAGYNGLGGTFFVSGNYEKAIENYRKFVELSNKESMKKSGNEAIAKCFFKLGESSKSDGKFE